MKPRIKKRWLVIIALTMIAVVGGTLYCVAKPVQAAHTHSFNVSAATCTTAKKCRTCGYVSQPALGHAYRQVTTKQPTCGASGTYETKCSRCGVGSPTGNGTIAPTGQHKWNRSAATCTEAKKCTVCGTVSQNALGHAYRQVTTKQPTCGAEGTYETKCSRCGVGSPTGNGTIPPTGKHNWQYTSTTKPTCTANGYDLYTCSVCKQTKKETIAKLGHAYSQVTTKQPTCGAEGTYETKCSRCGVGSPTGNGTIPPTGKHNWQYTSTTKPTCTKVGYDLYTCTVCKQTKKETIEKNNNHTMTITKKEATVTADGYEKKYCTECGYVEYNKVIPKLTITVTYNTAGGKFPNGNSTFKKSVTYGKTYGKVDIPSRTGYTFIGWYTGKTGGKAVSETTKVSEKKNHIVYAHWLKNNEVRANASDNTFSFVIDDFGGEDWLYYFVETAGSTAKISQPSWITSVKCTKSSRTISFKSQNTEEEPKDAYLYTYSTTSGKAITYTINVPAFRTVAVDVRGDIQTYYVPIGQSFTFPAAPELEDGEVFYGWRLENQSVTNQPGENITIYSNRQVSASIIVMYRKLGAVYNAADRKTYNIWMVTDGKENLEACKQKHNGDDLMIYDTNGGANGKDYKILDSWQFNDASFQQGVCELIIKYNQDEGRTSIWNRNLSGCMLEWEEHNLIYELFAAFPFKFTQEMAEQGRDVDLDAAGKGFVFSDVCWQELFAEYYK